MFCWGTFYLSRASTTCLIVEFLMTFWILSTSSTNISDFDIHQGTIKEEWLWLFGIFFSSMWLNSKAKSHLLIGSFFRCSSELCPNLQQMEASKATCGFADEMQWLRHDVRHFIKPVCTSSGISSDVEDVSRIIIHYGQFAQKKRYCLAFFGSEANMTMKNVQ